MILGMLIVGLMFTGLIACLIPYLIPPLDIGLPWGILGWMIACIPYAVVYYRGKMGGNIWEILDFPTPGQVKGLVDHGSSIYIMPIYSSIAGYFKNRFNRYYRDDPNGAANFGGHAIRHINDEVSAVYTPAQVVLSNKFERDGYYNWDEIVEGIKEHMQGLKNKSGNYVLTGKSDETLPIDSIDIFNNDNHKDLFEMLANKYFVKVNGQVYSAKNYNRYQQTQATPTVIGTFINFIKADAAIDALKIKKQMGIMSGKALVFVAIFVGLLLFIIVGLLFGMGVIQF